MSTALVSVIINTRNREKFLPGCIESVYAQTYQNFEIIVYDNCSSDNTREVVSRYDNRLRYVKSESPLSLGEARNKALKEARGDFICFLDSDDRFFPLKLEKQIPYFDDPEVGLVYSNCIIKNETNGSEKPEREQGDTAPVGDVFSYLLTNYFLNIATVIIRRAALGAEEANWFNPNLSYSEEAELFMRICYFHKVAYCPVMLSVYLVHPQSASYLTSPDIVAAEQEFLLSRLHMVLPGFSSRYREMDNEWRASIYRRAGFMHWLSGNRMKAGKSFLKTFYYSGKLKWLARSIEALLIPYEAYCRIRGKRYV